MMEKLVFRSSRPKLKMKLSKVHLLPMDIVQPTNMEIYVCNDGSFKIKHICYLIIQVHFVLIMKV